MDVADEEIFVCTSACEGMYLVMESILDDGDEVIVQAPYFTPLPPADRAGPRHPRGAAHL